MDVELSGYESNVGLELMETAKISEGENNQNMIFLQLLAEFNEIQSKNEHCV